MTSRDPPCCSCPSPSNVSKVHVLMLSIRIQAPDIGRNQQKQLKIHRSISTPFGEDRDDQQTLSHFINAWICRCPFFCGIKLLSKWECLIKPAHFPWKSHEQCKKNPWLFAVNQGMKYTVFYRDYFINHEKKRSFLNNPVMKYYPVTWGLYFTIIRDPIQPTRTTHGSCHWWVSFAHMEVCRSSPGNLAFCGPGRRRFGWRKRSNWENYHTSHMYIYI